MFFIPVKCQLRKGITILSGMTDTDHQGKIRVGSLMGEGPIRFPGVQKSPPDLLYSRNLCVLDDQDGSPQITQKLSFSAVISLV